MPDLSRSFQNAAVADTFAGFPGDARAGLLELRDLIFETARDTPGVGRIEETLKWGQPAYLTPDSKSGTTIRLGVPKTGGFALYVHCQTTLIAEFRSLFADGLTFDGNRAILFQDGQALPTEPLRLFIRNALTYHRE
ncbi:protein of unknown function (DU1801) [Aliiroseovarius sediminilitoris]|uniref:YdhG-like domain-containing protein n=1 Tax=Aliiroseovarius sediminilitoris TaxID=1173584 RepID=A0A1I0QVQ9_9RHOB|nr:DUF1801 domain-containing protein [Aliiroseovarius sediminilitoris]SEW31750.1 protein of unknown function (DU1801) [Aliiroseovarius sediminilitoris]